MSRNMKDISLFKRTVANVAPKGPEAERTIAEEENVELHSGELARRDTGQEIRKL